MLERFNFKDAIATFSGKKRGAADSFRIHNIVEVIVRDKQGNVKSHSVQKNLRTNGGADFWDSSLFKLTDTLTSTNTISSIAAAGGTAGPNATATTVYTGTFTNGGNNAYAGYIITLTGGSTAANNGTYLCIASTTTTITLANPNGAAQSSGTEPTVQTTVYQSQWTNGNYIALTTDSTAAAATDTTLASEETTNGLGRAQAADAHSAGATSSVLSKTFTYTGSTSKVIAKVGLFNQSANGIMVLETVLASTATVNANGDTITITWTINF